MWTIEEEEKRTLELIDGYVITGFRYTSEGYPEIRIENRNDVKYLLISQDAEDNGPGEFFIETKETV